MGLAGFQALSERVRDSAILRHSRWDAILILLALVHAAALVLRPGALWIAVSLWWNSNTIAHNFIHNPFFRASWLNSLFRLYLTALLGFPQTLWRERHLAHHAGIIWRLRISAKLTGEMLLVVGVWSSIALWDPLFFFSSYLPGFLIGLGLCHFQGYFEHFRGTTSHYGRGYNLLFFNDGYHCEHHRHPGRHWTTLSARNPAKEDSSRWPPLLRWLEVSWLEILERGVLRSRALQRFILACHRRAFQALMAHIPPVQRIGIIGGGLYPRTVLILRELLPEAELVVIDSSRENLAIARALAPGSADFIHETYRHEQPAEFDLLVIPLSFRGDKRQFYEEPPARRVLVHDWIWNRRGVGAVVSLFLLKRLNLVES